MKRQIKLLLLLTIVSGVCLSFGGCLFGNHDDMVDYREPQTAISAEELSDFNHGHPGRWSIDLDGNSIRGIPQEEHEKLRESVFQILEGAVFWPCKNQSEGDYEDYILDHISRRGHRYHISCSASSINWEYETEPLPYKMSLYDGEDGECYLDLWYHVSTVRSDVYIYVVQDPEIVAALTELAEAYGQEYSWPERGTGMTAYCEPQTAISAEELSDFNQGYPGRWSIDLDGNSIRGIPQEEHEKIRESVFQILEGAVFRPCKNQSERDYESYIIKHIPLGGHRYYISCYASSINWESETEPLPRRLALYDGEDGECYLELAYDSSTVVTDLYFYVVKDPEIVAALTELAEAYGREYPGSK